MKRITAATALVILGLSTLLWGCATGQETLPVYGTAPIGESSRLTQTPDFRAPEGWDYVENGVYCFVPGVDPYELFHTNAPTYSETFTRVCYYHGNGAYFRTASGEVTDTLVGTATYTVHAINWLFCKSWKEIVSCEVEFPQLTDMIYPFEVVYPRYYNGYHMGQGEWKFVGWSLTPGELTDRCELFPVDNDRMVLELMEHMVVSPKFLMDYKVDSVEPLDLYAVYQPVLSVTYELDGAGAGNYYYGGKTVGIGEPGTKYVIDYEPDPIPAQSIGYVFTGWSDERSGEKGKYRMGDTIVMDHPVVLHACWMTVEDYEKSIGTAAGQEGQTAQPGSGKGNGEAGVGTGNGTDNGGAGSGTGSGGGIDTGTGSGGGTDNGDTNNGTDNGGADDNGGSSADNPATGEDRPYSGGFAKAGPYIYDPDVYGSQDKVYAKYLVPGGENWVKAGETSLTRDCIIYGNGITFSGDSVVGGNVISTKVEYKLAWVDVRMGNQNRRIIINCEMTAPNLSDLVGPAQIAYPETYNGFFIPPNDWNIVGLSTDPSLANPRGNLFGASVDVYVRELLANLLYSQDEYYADIHDTGVLRLYVMYEPLLSVVYMMDGVGAGNYDYTSRSIRVGQPGTVYEIDHTPDPEPAAAIGYVFTGWSETAGQNWGEYRVGSTVPLTYPLTLHACWMMAEDYRGYLEIINQ